MTKILHQYITPLLQVENYISAKLLQTIKKST
jgi:hypothetical protein